MGLKDIVFKPMVHFKAQSAMVQNTGLKLNARDLLRGLCYIHEVITTDQLILANGST